MFRQFLLLVFVIVPSLALASDNCSNPVPVARHFFESSNTFYYQSPPETLMTNKFYRVVSKEIDCLKKEGLCGLDYYPWTGTQDGEIGEPVSFELESCVDSSDTAIVVMKLPFILSPKKKSIQHIVHLILRKEQSECWKVHDLITPLGDSLLEKLSSFHHEY
ncbi:MAG: hypothetical protein RQ867_09780 [Mariprofundaceae bacterium]|nr:hypothetical protein [Mariprofundaceae bacterium]